MTPRTLARAITWAGLALLFTVGFVAYLVAGPTGTAITFGAAVGAILYCEGSRP